MIESEQVDPQSTPILRTQAETHAYIDEDGDLAIKQVQGFDQGEDLVIISAPYIRHFSAKLTELPNEQDIPD